MTLFDFDNFAMSCLNNDPPSTQYEDFSFIQDVAAHDMYLTRETAFEQMLETERMAQQDIMSMQENLEQQFILQQQQEELARQGTGGMAAARRSAYDDDVYVYDEDPFDPYVSSFFEETDPEDPGKE